MMTRNANGEFVRNICFIIATVFFVVRSGAATNIAINNNGYEGIAIAFASHIPHHIGEPLIEHIKELFTNASVSLYKATRYRAYFKNITILVPQAWPRRDHYETAASEVFGSADIRIDDPNPEYGDGPYTLQDMGCGSPGLFIHITPNYLKNIYTSSKKRYGDPGRTLVHEWAHFRYGIFDEFGDPNNPMFPMFYPNEDEELEPNACTNGEVEGIRKYANGNSVCHGNEAGCIFLPNLERNEDITSSIGSYHFLKNVDTFCDDGEYEYHNPIAPNKHNLLCESRSTWNVIQESPDFQGNNNLPREHIADLVPNFRIVQQMEATYSLVLDTSTSMEDTGEGGKIPRRQILYDTVKRWLQEEVNLGAAVGIITFSTNSLIEYKITKIENEDIRRNIISKIPNKAIGSTAIGKGLRSAIKELYRYRQGPGGIIILVTDGQEVIKPFIEDVMPNLVESQARLVAIALHTTGSPSLEVAVKKTGGKMFNIPVDAGAEKLGMAFYEALTYQSNEYDLSQKIASKNFTGSSKSLVGTFFIDATVGNDTTVDFSTDVSRDIVDVTIVGPQLQSGISAAIVEDRLIRFKYPSLKEGTYTYTITRKSETSEIHVSVISKARSKTTKPIITRCWIQEDPKSTKEKPVFVILAEVKQGNNPVINAAVMAKIDRPTKKSVLLQLLDNGNGAPDVTHNDGIYSRHFSRFAGKGRYSVSAQVTDNGKASIQEVGFTASSSMPVPDESQGIRNVTTKNTGKFEREAEGGAFTVENDIFEETTDLFPPNRISDLRVANISDDRSFVTLKWTAPGDDFDYGNASSYDIRFSTNWTLLSTCFQKAFQVNRSSSPLPAGEEETLELSLVNFSPNISVFVAIQTSDKAGLTSKTSNIAQVSKPPQDTGKITVTTDNSFGNVTDSPEQNSTTVTTDNSFGNVTDSPGQNSTTVTTDNSFGNVTDSPEQNSTTVTTDNSFGNVTDSPEQNSTIVMTGYPWNATNTPDQKTTTLPSEGSNFKITLMTIRQIIFEGRWIPEWVKNLVTSEAMKNTTTIINS